MNTQKQTPATKGLVSVIVPTHNRAPLLKQALLSILAQRYPTIEIIIIANGCIDATEDIVREVQALSRSNSNPPLELHFLNYKEPLGGAKARNIGIDAARGEFVAFLDDDDVWHPDKLAAQVRLLTDCECAIVGASFFYLYGDNQYRPAGRVRGTASLSFPRREPGNTTTQLTLQDLSCENHLGGFSLCLTKKSHIGENRINEDLQALQDWDLWLKIMTATRLPACISAARLVYYRLDGHGHGKRLSDRHPQVIRAQQLFLQSWRNVLDEPSVNYHKMRTHCFQMKATTPLIKKLFCVLANSVRIIKTISRSRERGGVKRVIHYLLLPILDIDAVRVRFWKRRASKTLTGN